MKKLILVVFALWALMPSSFVLAGSCQCQGSENGDGSWLTCTSKGTAKSTADCGALNGKNGLDLCVYFSNDNCQNACQAAGLKTAENYESCMQDSDCVTKAGGFGVAKCCESNCYFDGIALDAYINLRTAFGGRIQLTKPELEIRIPGVTFSDVNKTLDSEGYIHIPFLGEYLTGIYKFALGAASILAAIIIILNGFRMVVSMGGEQKNQATKNVGKALIGLCILWGSYVLFYTINPELTKFKALKMRFIKTVPLEEIKNSIKAVEDIKGTTLSCGGYEVSAMNAVIDRDIISAANSQGLDPLILAAIFQQENRSRSVAVRGPCGEVGVTQLMPTTLEGLGKACCIATTKSNTGKNCGENVVTAEQIGKKELSEPYAFTCQKSICGHCAQASSECVDYFHDPSQGKARSMTFSAKLIKESIMPITKGDITLTFAAYNGGTGKISDQARAYAVSTREFYNQLCKKIGGKQ